MFHKSSLRLGSVEMKILLAVTESASSESAVEEVRTRKSLPLEKIDRLKLTTLTREIGTKETELGSRAPS